MKKRIEKHHDFVFLFGMKKIPVCFIYPVVFFIAFIVPLFSFAVPIGKVDSLMTVLQKTKTDSARARVMVYIADALQGTQPDKAIAMADSALQIIHDKGPDDIHAHAASIIGNIYNGKGMYQLALKYFIESVGLFDKLGNKREMANTRNSIGNTYFGTKDYIKALQFFSESNKIASGAGNELMVGITDVGISNVLVAQKQFKDGLSYLLKAKEIFTRQKREDINASVMTNIGGVYVQLGEYDLAGKFLNDALAFHRKVKDSYAVFSTEEVLGDLYKAKNNYDKALSYYFESFDLAKQMDAKDNIKDICKSISTVYSAKGDYKKALDYFNLYSQYKDSVFNVVNNSQLLEEQAIYETGKKQLDINLKNLELSKKQNKIDRQTTLQYVLIGAVMLFMLMAFLIFNRYKVKQKANVELSGAYKTLEQKNDVIAQKNKEITDSILYAKKIQDSFLPDKHFFNKLAPDSFLFYQPRDIVSGDFYWYNRIGDFIVFAVADCTGHGVPGAFLSAICNDMMNQVIRDLGVVNPEFILRLLDDKLRKQQDAKDTTGFYDGMDIAICSVDTRSNMLYFSGARRPLIIMRGEQLMVFKPTKFSIGEFFSGKKHFTEHVIQLNPKDCIYLFTDGIVDQFGGLEGKKFKYRKLLELFRKYGHLPMKEQYEIMQKIFHEWKGDLDQVDDICLVGIRM